jgi:diguanylate cyclase (GGDEF)-like protein
MAKILIVDDNATIRKLLVALLNHEGHVTIEAVDGADALLAARTQRPQLVISDILMPSMDGYEFVRQLRTDPRLSDTPVIFHTAHYHEREARHLAKTCNVARVLAKPSSTAEICQAVQQALAGTPAPATDELTEDFDREHLRLLTNKLSQQTGELRAANARLAALTELNVRLASERDPRVLLESVCHGARNLIASKYAVLAVAERPDGNTLIFSTSGIDLGGRPAEQPPIDAGALGKVMTEGRAWRVFNSEGRCVDSGLPDSYPPASAIVAVPLSSLTTTYGWLCLADKLGADGFSAEDERILCILGAQVGRIYENGKLFREAQHHAAQLLMEMSKLEQAQARIEQLNRVHAMLSGINSLIVRVNDRAELFKEACRLAVEQGRFALAWCGWYDADAAQVKPVAWAGDSADLAQRVRPIVAATSNDDTLIATALRSQRPAVCNELEIASTGVLDAQAMLERGYHAKVVLPLVIAGKSVGCLALVTRERNFFDDEEIHLLTELAGDVSFALDHIEKAEKLNHLAYYDVLTELANRTFFHERLAQYVSTAGRGGHKLALVIADLERFESINDTLGRHAGDQLLRQMAERFVSCVGDPNAVGRVGPDHFAAVIPDVREESEVARTVESWWQQWLDPPFHVDGQELRISVKAGIALFPGDGNDAESLFKNAEAALKNAKTTGHQRLFYTRQLSEKISEKLALEIRLRHALEHEEFVLHYQPKVSLETRQLTGVEALIRWQSPEWGLVPPLKFIPIMEETGMIAQVGAWVLHRASLDRASWLERRLRAPRVAVNVSTDQLRREDFVRTISRILESLGGKAGIDIEVTESLLMENVADSIEKLTIIRDLGVGIAIDDFGTGFSSLGYLAKLPVKTLKIDRSFVSVMLDDPSTMTLISTIISLAHAMKLDVVTEGVESEEQAKILRLLRCDQMQGFLISKPLSFDDMTTYLVMSGGGSDDGNPALNGNSIE